MEIRNSICEAVDGIALLHPVLRLIIAWGLGQEIVDYLFPESLRRDRLLIFMPWLPVHHFAFRRKTLMNGKWGGLKGYHFSVSYSLFSHIIKLLCAIPSSA